MDKRVLDVATREHLLKILKEVSERMKAVDKELIKKYDIEFSNKNLSEIIGKIMEKVSADIYTKELNYKVKNAKSDKEPDLDFTKLRLPMEIKVTSTKNSWTGGEFSKRPFHYFLVSWGEEFDKFFVCVVKLEKSDWKSNISKNYYGPSLSLKKLREIEDKLILVGEIDEKGRMKREKV